MITPAAEYRHGTIAAITCQKRPAGNQKTRDRTKYKDVVCAFDIETTRLIPEEQAIMYIWQFCIHGHCTVVGRTWQELDRFLFQIWEELEENERLVVYVHNLSYEFHFLRAIHEWEPDEVFALDSRKVCKAVWQDRRIEFRCSYLHSNMSLAQYTRKFDVQHQKLSGEEFDYSVQRYPWTPLTEREMEYCVNDVIGLCEALEAEMELWGDNLYTIPLTSTGYVRREAKREMRKVSFDLVRRALPTWGQFEMLREAFRGGNTHANRYYVSGVSIDGVFSNRSIKNVNSADRSSSYPDVICNELFPMSAFHPMTPCTKERIIEMMSTRRKALLMRVAFSGIRLKDPYWGCPYIPLDKCRRIPRDECRALDNGRVISASYLEITLTDIDFEIILEEYEADDITPIECYYARYAPLPDPLKELIIGYYKSKTELKGLPDQAAYYEKQKNLLNSAYGMMVQNPCKDSPVFDPTGASDPTGLGSIWGMEQKDPREILTKHNQSAFLLYQWGVWVTAWARLRLEEGIRLAHGLDIDGNEIDWTGKHRPNFIYSDTDSVKYTGEIDWEPFNRRARAASQKSGACADDRHGVRHYMGVYEWEGCYQEFKTMGSKKYCYVDSDGETHCTIAGVNKRKGGPELDKHGGLAAFREGFIFREAGGTEAVYNDRPDISEVIREGRKIFIRPNIVLRPSTYTLGISDEYQRILNNLGEIWNFGENY